MGEAKAFARILRVRLQELYPVGWIVVLPSADHQLVRVRVRNPTDSAESYTIDFPVRSFRLQQAVDAVWSLLQPPAPPL